MKPIFRSTPRTRRARPQQHQEVQPDVQTAFFQPKLSINAPGDQYEREADAVADTVVNDTGKGQPAVQRMPISTVQRLATPEEEKMPATNDGRMAEDKKIQEKPMDGGQSTADGGRVQKMDAPKEEEKPVQKAAAEEEEPVQKMDAPKEEEKPVQKAAAEEEESVQKMDAPKEEEKPVQKASAPQEEEQPVQAKAQPGASKASPDFSARLSARKGQGQPLPAAARTQMEQGIGADFSRVRIHTDPEAAEMNKDIHAQAFTHGSDVYFNSGKFNPENTEGKRLLAHELTHVVQQGGGPDVQRKIDDGHDLRSHRFRHHPDLEAVFDGEKMIQSGSSGAGVQMIQQGLIDSKHLLPKFGADGNFGPETKAVVKQFQEAHGLAADGVIGPKTMEALDLYLSIDPGKKPQPPKPGSPEEKLRTILAKGLNITPQEAKEAKTALFELKQDDFRIVLKQLMQSGEIWNLLRRLNLMDILTGVMQVKEEVVIPTTLLSPAANTIDADFKRANEIYNPHGFEIEKGNAMTIGEDDTKKILGDNLALDDGANKTLPKEGLDLVKRNRVKGRITGYWVPDLPGLRGLTITKKYHTNLPDERESVLVNTKNKAQDTFAHELGHILWAPKHHDDPNNLMAGGEKRNIAGKGIDQLTDDQVAIIRSSVFIELGKKGIDQ